MCGIVDEKGNADRLPQEYKNSINVSMSGVYVLHSSNLVCRAVSLFGDSHSRISKPRDFESVFITAVLPDPLGPDRINIFEKGCWSHVLTARIFFLCTANSASEVGEWVSTSSSI